MIVTMGSATSSRLNQFRGVPVNSVHRFMYKVIMAGLLARKIVSGLFVYKKVSTGFVPKKWLCVQKEDWVAVYARKARLGVSSACAQKVGLGDYLF